MERENGIRTDGMAGGLARRLLERSMPESTNEDDGTMPDLDSLIARNRELQQRLEAVGEEGRGSHQAIRGSGGSFPSSTRPAGS